VRGGRRNAWVLLPLLLLLSQGCGKKAPPFVPGDVFTLRVEGLKTLAQGDQVLLTGALVTGESRNMEKPAGVKCRVYTLHYPLENAPCEGCPLPFEKFEEVQPDIFGDGKFQCTFPLGKEKGIYFFMVRLVDRNGNVGPPSGPSALRIM
jgi:hypothetical protein